MPRKRIRKHYRSIILYTLVCLFVVTSCGKKKDTKNNALLLDSRYLQIDNIHSFANCQGPDGRYTTEVTSKKDGTLFFSQIYTYRDAPFRAVLSSDRKGYSTDKNGKVLDTLSNIAIEMIRSHDFHRLHTNPTSFFNTIKFEKNVAQKQALYTAIDRLSNPVKIYYDKTIEQIRGIEFLNMMDTTEVIEVTYKKWIDSDHGKLAKEIEIVQAKKDTFHFDFTTININK